MSGLDIAIVLIMGVSLLYSLYRGLVREIFSLLAIVLGFVAACRWYGWVAGFLHRWTTNEAIGNLSGFLLTLLVAVILMNLLGRLARGFVRLIQLGAVDRLLGAIFGILKGLVIAGIVVVALVAFLPPANPTLARSRLVPYLFQLGNVSQEVLPEGLRETIRKRKEALLSGWNQRLQNQSKPEESLFRGNRSGTLPHSSARK